MVSIGYSALSSSLMVTGEANFRVREDVRITGIKVLSFENEGYETYTAEYYKDGTKVMVTLPKTDSKVTYEVEIKNTSENSYQLKEIKDEITSNPEMKYEIEGLALEDMIGPSETKTFQIVVSYQDGTSKVPNENAVTFETRYVFEIVQVTPPQTGNTFAEYLKSIANPETITTYADANGNKQEMYTFKHEATEQTEKLTDYRYIGDSPNNYVYFNCTDDNSVETCEKWRIIGVFPVEDENGKIEDRVKIIRDASIGNIVWNKNGDNNWETSSLNEYLKETYSTSLSDTAKAMMGNTKYYLGGSSTEENLGGPDYYEFERGRKASSGAPFSWVGRIGLMYPSDYAYTYALGVNDKCYTDGYNCSTNAGGNPSLGWLYQNKIEWTLAPGPVNMELVFNVVSAGCLYYHVRRVTDALGVRPVLYLAPNVSIGSGGGDGSRENPYILDLPPEISFDYLTGIYGKPKLITITAEDNNYSYMNVEVRNSKGKVTDKSQNNINENTYMVTLEEEDTYTIFVTAYDEYGIVAQAEQQYVIRKLVAVEKLKAETNSDTVASYVSGHKKDMFTFKHEATEQTKALTDYRYIGNDPYNYVYFNCKNENEPQSSTNCETWRIIGIFPVDDGKGNIEERVKIIKDTSIGKMTWDSNYVNNWETASLNIYLNGTYYNGLSDTAKAMIGNTKYYLGGSSIYQNLKGPDYYKFERGTTVYDTSRPIYWVGMIALMYPSDYAYTYALGVNDKCYTDGYNCDTGTPSSGWLFNGQIQWTLFHVSNTSYAAFFVGSTGYVRISNFVLTPEIRPTLYLVSNVFIVGGNGNKDNPYQLAM